jgi:cobalt-zinc-cadmium efflux system outer membrane protein
MKRGAMMITKFNRPPLVRLVALAITILTVVSVDADAQQVTKKEYVLRGKVERVDTATKRLTVHSEPIQGWMGEMTMGYAVDNEALLNRVRVGDQITAKVYEGDSTLHDVQLVSSGSITAAPGAVDKAGLRLEDLEQIALANNPTVAQVQANLRAAMGFTKQAGLYPNPTVGYYGDEIRGGYIGGGKQGGFISQTIVMGGKLGAARRVAELETNEIQTTAQIQRLRIQNNVRALFYQVLAAQRLVEVRQNLAKLAADATQTSLQLGNVGQADRPDILQAELEEQQAMVSVKIAQHSIEASWRMLAAVVGRPDLPVVTLEGDLETIPDLNYEESIATTLRESPELKLAEQAVERAEASLVQEKKVPIPDLQVTGILIQSFEPLDTTGRPTGVQAGAQIGIQLPFFNRNQGNIAAARGEIDSAKRELARLRLQLQRELASMFRNYDSARVTAEQYKTELLPRAEQAYRLYQANYQKMSAAYPQVLISQRTLFQLEADYIQALENAWQSSLAIRGFGLMDGLSAPIGTSMTGLPQADRGASAPQARSLQ